MATMVPNNSNKSIGLFVVDDDRSVRRALKRLLRIAGYEVTTFKSAQEFISSGNDSREGVLIIDVRMQGMNGLELQKKLICQGCEMPIIFITAHRDSQARDIALEAGAVASLFKPFEDQVLLEAIQGAVGKIGV